MSAARGRAKAGVKAAAKKAKARSVLVRMYNVGFGDAFVLTFPTAQGDRRMLIDCGVHGTGPGPRKIREVAQAIIDDLPADARRIDVVVATHRHQDHVQGFSDWDQWSDVEVGEVWMPWTEHPTNKKAREIRETQSRTAKLLFDHGAASLGADEQRGATWFQLAVNALTNAKAMKTLHEGFAGDPERRFFPAQNDPFPLTMTTDAIPGLTVRVLGPSWDRDVIRDMIPPEAETYAALARLAAAAPGGGVTMEPPFDERWLLPREKEAELLGDELLDADERALVQRTAAEETLDLATSLDKAVNGTSLMFVLEFGSARMLFPGDAQWGTWKQALGNDEARSYLSSINFLKVGHHGSHNATPKSFVEELLPEKLWAVVSTREHTGDWDEIPLVPLLDSLRDGDRRVVRSDRADVPDPKATTGFAREAENLYVDIKVRC